MSGKRNDIINILVCGVGGQGVMTAAEILAQTAISLGFDTKKTEVSGMSQRGGIVTSHVRFGEKVMSPSIPAGEADILIGFEPAEAMRAIGQLRPGGVALVNTMRITPPIVSVGIFDYPDDPVGEIRKNDCRVYDFDAGKIAESLGEMRLGNTVMLGAVADHLPFDAKYLHEQMIARFKARKPELVALNEQAFEAGRKAAAA
ncbi:MAG: indolepyruvate oxidoreductase subunit beta [Rhodospirillales bacterium]|nr:indolepyruvate oxidoreductase subunit beta [Rhodospirillales bacterium]